MDKQLFDTIVELARESHRDTIFKDSHDPEHVGRILSPGGGHETFRRDPAPRSHRAASIDTVAKFAEANEDDAAVWYSRAGFVVLIDDADRRDRVAFPLTLTPQLELLQKLEKQPTPLQQKPFVTFLRVNLADCLGRTGSLLNTIRSLKFRTTDSGESTIAQGKASMGRAIESQVWGEDAVPDEVTLDVPIFVENCGVTPKPIRCALDLDGNSRAFTLTPLAGQIEAALQAAERELAEAIKGKHGEAPLYFGKP
jgi:hypothetical protein